MKKYLKPATLPWFVLITGGMGIALRFWLLSSGVDAKGLLKSGHPAIILLWILTVITAGVVIYGCLPLVEAYVRAVCLIQIKIHPGIFPGRLQCRRP